MERITRNESTVEVDLTVPVNIEKAMAGQEESCFGRMYDMRMFECAKCADRDVCSIVFADKVVKPKTAAIQEEQGAIFLDLTDFKNVTDEVVFAFIKSGETTTGELLAHVMAKALTSDEIAGIEFLKRFITSHDNVYTKGGLVWLR